MARALARQGDKAAASLYYARAASPRPGGTTLNSARLTDGEAEALRRAAAERPGHAPSQIAWIGVLLQRGQGGEALALARAVQRDNPGAPEAHMLVGDALGIQGNFAAAAEEYRKAANLAFTEPVAMRMIEALQRSGQGPAAGRVLDLFLQQNPRNISGQRLAAARHMQEGRWAEAIPLYEGLRRRLGDRDASILNNLAWAYSEQGDYRQALPLARKAWMLDPNNPATTDTLGWLLFKSGSDRKEGLALLERAARGAPSDGEIRKRLEQARRS
jgi:cellulose synthase operon protein C